MRFLFALSILLSMSNAYGLDLSVLQKPANPGAWPPPSIETKGILWHAKGNRTFDLIPQDSILVSSIDDPRLSRIIDEITENILKTRVGLQICQKSIQVRNIHLYTKLGLSEKALRQSSQICPIRPSDRRDVSPESLAKYFQRKIYLFAISDSAEAPIDSWTLSWGMDKATVLVIRPSTVTAESLYRAIAHEIYMSLDIKNSFPFQKSPQTGPACFISSALHEPLIRYTLSTYRALQIENQILAELGFETEKLPAQPSIQDLQDVSATLLPLLKTEKISNERRDAKSLYFQCYEETSIEEKWEILNQEKVAGDSSQTLLQYLSQPELQEAIVDGGFDPGPRPNIGGGTGLRKAQIVLSQNLPANSLEKKKLDQMKEDLNKAVKEMNEYKSAPPSSLQKPSYLEKKSK